MIDKLVQLCYAIAGIVAIVGALGVYIHMNNDGKKTAKHAMITVGAIIALITLAQSLPYLAH